MPDEEAREIYQRHLDAMSDAVWARDGDGIAALLDETVDVVTGDRTLHLVGREASVRTLVAFSDAMRGIGATSYHRTCATALRTASDTIEGTHTTYILRGGNYAIDPYGCDQTIRLRDGAWIMVRTRVERHYLGAASFNPGRARLAKTSAASPVRDSERTPQ